MSNSENQSSTSNTGTRHGLRNDQISGVFLLLLALYIWWQNRAYPLGSLSEPGPGYVPLLLSIFMGAMGLLVAIRGGHSAPFRDTTWSEGRRAILILVICGLATFALERLGYRITMLAALILFLGIIERRKPWMVLAVAVPFSLISYYVFAKLLKVPLPMSPWGW